MTEQQDGDAAREDVKDRCNDPAQGKARDAADTVAGGTAIGDAGADSDEEASGDQDNEVLARVGGEGFVERVEQDRQEKDTDEKCDTFARAMVAGTVHEAAENAARAHDAAIGEQVNRPAGANHKAPDEAPDPVCWY